MGGKSSTISNSEQRILSMQVQQSSYGLALPIVFGQNRISGNLIDYTDFTAIQKTERTRSGGKGGGGVTQENTTYTYEAAVIMALCHGPINGIASWWRDKERHTSLSDLGLTLVRGEWNQQPWAWMQGKHPQRALSYSDTAYLCSPNYHLGNSAQVPNHMFEVAGLLQKGGKLDALASDIVRELLVNPSYGAGFPAARLADLRPYADCCMASGFYLSPVLQEQREAREHLADIFEQTHAAPVWSEGRLKIIPYADEAIVGDEATYTPNTAPLYDLTDEDFLVRDGQDPVAVEVKDVAERYNHITVEWLDRANNYNIATCSAKDQTSIARDGYRPKEPLRMHGICLPDVAARAAAVALQRALYVTRTFTFRLGWRYCLLEPMDIVTLTDPGLGLSRTPVRITAIEEDGDSGELTITAEDFAQGSGSASIHPPQPALGAGVAFNAAPGDCHVPVMFEAPLQLTGNTPQIWLAAAGGADWGGCSVWVSTDGDTYQRIGQLDGKSRYGTTTSALAADATVLDVDIAACGGQLHSASPDDAQHMHTACYVDGEYLAYTQAALTGVGTYRLSGLVRGAWGSSSDAHRTGSAFVRLAEPLFRYSYPPDWLGKTVYIKLTSYNLFGAAEQSLADVSAWPYTIVGAPLGAVQNLRMTSAWQVGRDASFAWDALPDADSYDVQIATPERICRTMTGLRANHYTYTPQDARSDGGPWRHLVIRVRARAVTGRTGEWTHITASNPQVGELHGIQVTPLTRSAHLTFTQPAEDDFAGVRVHVSEQADFVPDDSNLVFEGAGNLIAIDKLGDGSALQGGGKTYYVRIAGYDTFGTDGLHYSQSLAFSVWDISDIAKDLNASHLTQSLREQIDAGSQAGQKIADETLARIAALRQESLARQSAVVAASQKAAADLLAATRQLEQGIETVRQNAQDGQQRITGEVTTLAATTQNALSGLRSQQQTMASQLQAESQQRQTLAARVAANASAITQEASARTAADAAHARDISAANARLGAAEGGITALRQTVANNHEATTTAVNSLRASFGAASGANLLPNASFAEWAGGVPARWGLYNNSRSTQPETATRIDGGLDKSQAIRITWSGRNSSTKGISTGAALWDKGEFYVLAVCARVPAGQPENGKILLHYSNQPHWWDYEYLVHPTLSQHWQWTVMRARKPVQDTGYYNQLHISVDSTYTGEAVELCLPYASRGEMWTGYKPAAADAQIAAVRTETAALANQKQQIAQQITTLTAENNARKAAVEVATRAIDGLKAQYTVKVQAGNVVSGFGLASEPVNGKTVSSFVVAADKFGIAAPGVSTQHPFVVDTARKIVGVNGNLVVNGQAVINNVAANTVSGTKIQAGTLHGTKIQAGTVTADRLKVTNLAAINANLGAVTSGSLNINGRFIVDAAGNVTIRGASSGARLTISNNLVQVFDANGRLRVRMGIW